MLVGAISQSESIIDLHIHLSSPISRTTPSPFSIEEEPRYSSDNMTSLRAFRPQDLFHMNLTNLDPLTENYNIDFYMHYLINWPSLFTVAEDQDGNIIGYSNSSLSHSPLQPNPHLPKHPTNPPSAPK